MLRRLILGCAAFMALSGNAVAVPGSGNGWARQSSLLWIEAAARSDVVFDFRVESLGKGVVRFKDLLAAPDFPNLELGQIEKVRFYHEFNGFTSVSELSRFVEFELIVEDEGFMLSGNKVALPAGGRAYFKVGLVDRSGKLVYLTPDFDSDPARHSVVVR